MCADGCGNTDDLDEVEVVELETENGEKEEFAILYEVDFENRHFAITAPLAGAQAYSADPSNENEKNLSIEIFVVDGDDFQSLEDDELAKRLLSHLEELAAAEE